MSGDCIIYYTLYIIYNLPHSWWSSWSPPSPGSGCRSCILESRLKLKLATFDKYFWNQLGVSEFRYRLNFEKYFSNLLGCWSVFETCLAVDQLCRRSCQSRAPEEEIKSTTISSALQKMLDVRRQDDKLSTPILDYFDSWCSVRTWKLTPASSKYFTIAGSSLVVAMCRTFSP